MLKKMSLRKIAVTTSALLILLMFYFFPVSDKTIDFNYEIVYEEDTNLKVVYLINSDYYVSMLNINLDSTKDEDIIKEKISILTRGSDKTKKIPKSFNALIPGDTKLIGVKIEKSMVTLNFSKEFLNIEEELEEKMIEAIVFSLTELKNINKVKINVDGNALECLPNSKKKLPSELTREYGINKKYDLDNLGLTQATTVYYNDISEDYNYYIPVTKITNSKEEKISIIINELKSSTIAQDNLGSYLSNDVFLEKYDLKDDKMTLTFNEKIFDGIDNKTILEEVKYAISMSVIENYGVKEVVFNVKNEKNAVSVSKTLE